MGYCVLAETSKMVPHSINLDQKKDEIYFD